MRVLMYIGDGKTYNRIGAIAPTEAALRLLETNTTIRNALHSFVSAIPLNH
jgi:hypothetical protein